ncbi:MAG: outer membrane lipid asymmetry maintenance protein MlaD [Tistlia sp.]|uniref:outer membrane lipid asymmetry maintenance protein MlaD n=1 Tax=Tistlia sp. TaxID=3057121 RepID=UPI0034A5C4D3
MHRNIIETILGGVVLLVAAGFVVFAFSVGGLSGIGSGYGVTARFDDATGIATGSEVRMSGIKIGTVSGQSLDSQTFDAIIRMNIDQNVELPSDTSARIVPDGLLGSNYVELQPGGSLENIADGGSIARTQGAINVIDLVGRFIFGGGDVAPAEGAPSDDSVTVQ